MDSLSFSDVFVETKGFMSTGQLKLTNRNIIFENRKTGKTVYLSSSDIGHANWMHLVGGWCLRVFQKNGSLFRFYGIKDSGKYEITKHFAANYETAVIEKELSLKGWNWGTARFEGSVLNFDVGDKTAFEIPLNSVSQCTTGKNEVALGFQQNDDASVGLMEMRFHISPSESAGNIDTVEAFRQLVMKKAGVINLSGDAIATFKGINSLTPRGRYDIKIFQSCIQLHGKTFDFKVPISTVIRLFGLPHQDGRQMFFVVSLDPPIKQGQTRYHYLVFQFGQDNEISIELPLSDEELQEKYEGKLKKQMTGPTCKLLAKVIKAIVKRKITTPRNFVGHSGTPAVGCSYKATAGYLYPLEKGLIYIHKPPVHLRFDEITSVNFARRFGGTRSFDFEVETKSGVVHTFSSIENDEYGKLFDFIASKKLKVKNTGENDDHSYTEDFGNSVQEDEPDAYLARVIAEARGRDEDGGGDSGETTDEDFNPNQQESDVAEEYDSNPITTGSEDSEASGSEKPKKKEKKEPVKSTGTVPKKPRKKQESKKLKDENKPKRPATAFMLWLNEHREQIKSENPGISFTEMAKKAGEQWKKVNDKSKWEKTVAAAKERYNQEMKEYIESGGGTDAPPAKKKEKKETMEAPRSSSPTSFAVKSEAYKSKEFVSDDDSNTDSGDDKMKKSAPAETTVKKEPKCDESSSDSSKAPLKKVPETDDAEKEAKKDNTSDDDGNIDELIKSTPPTTEDENSGSYSKMTESDT